MTERDPNLNREQTELLPVEEDTQDSAPASKSEKNLGKSMIMKVALASVLLASLVISIANLMRTNQLRDQTDEYQAEIKDYKEKIARLKYYINKDVDDEYIIEYAREYLDMYFPDEEIYYNDVNE
jgi:cell division protein FtsB